MPITNVNGIELYYEVHGEGEPLLMIMGLAHNLLSWKKSLPGLAEHFKVIVFIIGVQVEAVNQRLLIRSS